MITGYKRDGVVTMDFDPMDELDSFVPVVEMLPAGNAIFPAAGRMKSFRRMPKLHPYPGAASEP